MNITYIPALLLICIFNVCMEIVNGKQEYRNVEVIDWALNQNTLPLRTKYISHDRSTAWISYVDIMLIFKAQGKSINYVNCLTLIKKHPNIAYNMCFEKMKITHNLFSPCHSLVYSQHSIGIDSIKFHIKVYKIKHFSIIL